MLRKFLASKTFKVLFSFIRQKKFPHSEMFSCPFGPLCVSCLFLKHRTSELTWAAREMKAEQWTVLGGRTCKKEQNHFVDVMGQQSALLPVRPKNSRVGGLSTKCRVLVSLLIFQRFLNFIFPVCLQVRMTMCAVSSAMAVFATGSARTTRSPSTRVGFRAAASSAKCAATPSWTRSPRVTRAHRTWWAQDRPTFTCSSSRSSVSNSNFLWQIATSLNKKESHSWFAQTWKAMYKCFRRKEKKKTRSAVFCGIFLNKTRKRSKFRTEIRSRWFSASLSPFTLHVLRQQLDRVCL